jgi:hypothetical protein
MKTITQIILFALITLTSTHADESKLEDIKSSGSNLAPMPMSTVMNLRGRFDWIHSENKNTDATTKQSQFSTEYLRLVTDGKVTDTTKFSLTLKPLDTNIDGNMVDTAVVTKKMNDSFSLLIGKHSAMIGGRENDYSDYDLFLVSLFKNSLPSGSPGASLQYEVANQTLFFQALKAPMPGAHSAYIYGVSYYGNLVSGKILPIFSYHQESTDRAGAKNKYIALGVQAYSGTTIVEFDWLNKSEEKNGFSEQSLETTSMVFQLRYNHERYKPFAKMVIDKKEHINGSVTQTERAGWEAGVEFYPVKEEDLHYHVVYNSAETKDKGGGTATSTEARVFLGATFSFNILK